MHPTVCAAVSRLSYDGRLQSLDEVTAARTLDGQPPGVRVVTVDHDGNSTDSPEEADAIVAEIRRLLGTAWTDEHGTVPLAQERRAGRHAVQRAGGDAARSGWTPRA